MHETKRSRQAFTNFDRALQRLEHALAMPLNEDTRDIIILRFMFTYETAWKAMRWILREYLLIETTSPRQVLQEAFTQGWLGENSELWLNMADDRNLIVHTYDEKRAQEIYEHVKIYACHMQHMRDSLIKAFADLST